MAYTVTKHVELNCNGLQCWLCVHFSSCEPDAFRLADPVLYAFFAFKLSGAKVTRMKQDYYYNVRS